MMVRNRTIEEQRRQQSLTINIKWQPMLFKNDHHPHRLVLHTTIFNKTHLCAVKLLLDIKVGHPKAAALFRFHRPWWHYSIWILPPEPSVYVVRGDILIFSILDCRPNQYFQVPQFNILLSLKLGHMLFGEISSYSVSLIAALINAFKCRDLISSFPSSWVIQT